MPRKTLKQLAPSQAQLQEMRGLRFLGDWVFEPNLWHINRFSASMAFFVGLFVAFLPIPGQMIVAASLALLLRCNLPLSVGLVWITNPVTIPAVFYLAYRVGAMVLDVPVLTIEFELSIEWLRDSLSSTWQPLLVGSLICGTLFGSAGFFIVSMMWRWRVASQWRRRKRRRQQAKLES
jgi:uncharacterized protein (DUF2062 family)